MTVARERRVRPEGQEGRARTSGGTERRRRSRWCSSRRSETRQAVGALGRSAAAGGARPRAREPPDGAAARRAARRARPEAPPGDADRAEGDPAAGSGFTFIYVTHDQEEALTMSDRLAVFNQGRIEQVGTPAEVYERPATGFVAGFVGTSNILSGDRGRDRGRLARTRSPCARRRSTWRTSTRRRRRRRVLGDRARPRGRIHRCAHEVRRRARRRRGAGGLPAEPRDVVDGGAPGQGAGGPADLEAAATTGRSRRPAGAEGSTDPEEGDA